jgi:pyruvyltransferase
MSVEIVHWNPRRPLSQAPWARYVPIRRRVRNFGDLLGPRIVNELLRRAGLTNDGHGRLLTVGSIIHLSSPNDTIWGSGVNGKIPHLGGAPDLDIRAVRGPITRARLLQAGTSNVPEVYGDPGLLCGLLWPRAEYLRSSRTRHSVTIVPNFHEWTGLRADHRAVNPCAPLNSVISRIARSELVVGSSLHGVIVAESMGVPARLVVSEQEPALKYLDYYAGSGRADIVIASGVREALELGGATPPSWDPGPLLDAFPYDLFTNRTC